MSKIILHIDLNAFFVRCEEIKDPSLEGKPVIIGHNGRGGIVSTCSYAARKYGVHSGMPTYQALLKCKDAILIPGDYRYYEQKSNEFFAFIKKYTTLVDMIISELPVRAVFYLQEKQHWRVPMLFLIYRRMPYCSSVEESNMGSAVVLPEIDSSDAFWKDSKIILPSSLSFFF